MDFDKLIQQINEKFDSTEFSTRITTINSDLNRYFRTSSYEVKGSEGDNKNKALPGMTFVTGNQPQVWANHCMAILTSQAPKIKITRRDANMTNDEIELIRNWWETVFYLANEECEGIVPIHEHMAWNAVLTDNVIPRAIIENKTKLKFDIQIAETAGVCWQKGKNGTKWVAYRISKTKDEILDEYPNVTVTKDVEDETHYWGYQDDKVVEIVFIGKVAVADENGEKIRDWSASMDTLPITINPILMNPEVRVDGTLMSSGASVYWGARDAFDEQNRAKSVKATLLMREASPALKHKSTDAQGNPGSPLEKYPTDGTVVEMGNAVEEIDYIFKNTPTALQAAEVYHADSTKETEQATAPEIAYGGQEYSHMPTSLWDRRAFQMGKVLFPRRKAMETAYKAIFNKILEQFIKMNVELKVETERGISDQKITSSELEKLNGKYKVEFEVTSVEPSGDLLKFQKKLAADQAGVDPDWSDENILDYPDLTRVREGKVKRQALALDPTLFLFEDYAIACKELDMMEPGPMKDMKAMEIKYRKASLELIARQAVNGGQDAQR